ncbi:MAG: PadR family transcriptional regulator [Methanomassiliicoccales archaeon]
MTEEDFRRTFAEHGYKSGFLRLVLLKLISGRPCHGYELMKSIERATDGEWHPSPGSVYPALQELEGKGLVECRESGRKRVYAITPRGEELLEQGTEHMRAAMRHIRNLLLDEEE